MIQHSARAFGYGKHSGITCGSEELDRPLAAKEALVAVFSSLPSESSFNSVARGPLIQFCVIPPCSSYSHFAAAIWSIGVPTLAIQNPEDLKYGVRVYADFDRELLLVAESESEAEELRKLTRDDNATNQGTSAARRAGRSQATVRVLAEVNCASEVRSVLADGADGLGVVKCEQLFSGARECSDETEGLLKVIRGNPQFLPFLVRFFDLPQGGGVAHSSHAYLGHRGVRILEVDDSWLQRFEAGLEILDVEPIVVILPMITSASEIRRFRRKVGVRWCRVGVTAETPAAALRIEELLEVTDFVEIGLNDLTQYTMAWDRDSPNEERLPSDRVVGPVADLIGSIAKACTSAGVPYTLGIDLRPTERLAAQVLDLGIRSISCAPPLVRRWKDAFSTQS